MIEVDKNLEIVSNSEEKVVEEIEVENKYLVPGSIVIAGIIIALAVMNPSNGSNVVNNQVDDVVANEVPPDVAEQAILDAINPVTNADHILGDINAPVKLVEYSDYECPFCKRFHDELDQVRIEYVDSGKVAIVYRHFPLDQLHPVKARAEAVASECAAEQGGNKSFWAFTDRFFELTPSNNQTDIETVLPQIAGEIGLDVNKFATCLDSGKYDDHIQADVENAIATGGRGTPWSILIGADGTKYPINGALPYSSLKPLIESAL